jgi:zinc/manganese transport system substrate-binding protein
MKKTEIVLLVVVIVIFAIIGFLIFRGGSGGAGGAENVQDASSSPPLQVVAAENFWGSIVTQIGGSRVQVLSLVTDPNADPHEYESNALDARAVATANYVIMNGAGYDSWMGKLIGAGSAPDRKVLDVADLLGKKNGDNPHFWYNPDYVETVAAQIESDLISLDPAHAAYYAVQYQQFQNALAPYHARIAAIKQQFAGTKVAATEDIFSYLAVATGLDLVSPPAFITAVAEGNDPPSPSVVTFEDQLASGQVKILVYNEQTITPLTTTIRAMAIAHGIPVVGITETIQPPTLSFEDWMNGELDAIQSALASSSTR